MNFIFAPRSDVLGLVVGVVHESPQPFNMNAALLPTGRSQGFVVMETILFEYLRGASEISRAWYDGEDSYGAGAFLGELSAYFHCAFSQRDTLIFIFLGHRSQVI